MKTPFDPAKNMINRAKHGLDLFFGDEVLRDRNLIEAVDTSMNSGEERFNRARPGQQWHGLRRHRHRAARG
ncbi:BrnT family toxin [Azospirillum doebereinerae]|uniref:BrnT family toxin n=1 Tax=Azospirillum doebereinerae TaxID=92933 RepID=UPI001FCFB7A5|nr:BrnT family toxin [Azospirillum doebereinerae]